VTPSFEAGPDSDLSRHESQSGNSEEIVPGDRKPRTAGTTHRRSAEADSFCGDRIESLGCAVVGRKTSRFGGNVSAEMLHRPRISAGDGMRRDHHESQGRRGKGVEASRGLYDQVSELVSTEGFSFTASVWSTTPEVGISRQSHFYGSRIQWRACLPRKCRLHQVCYLAIPR
jgi:hypothetical protein